MARFKNLIAYQRAADLADELRATVATWPSIDQWTVGVQLVRAADSVGANIAEAIGRSSPPDQLRLLLIARGSAYELQHWIERAIARSLLPHGDSFRMRSAAVGRLVNGLMRAYRNRARPTTD